MRCVKSRGLILLAGLGARWCPTNQIRGVFGGLDSCDPRGRGRDGSRGRGRAHDGSLQLICTQERLLKIFRITGLAKVFTIHASTEAATG